MSPEETNSPSDVEVVLYSDGACAGNPGPGGWAFILHHLPSGKVLEVSGAVPLTTNNQMELQAAIEGLENLKRPTNVRLVTDSTYLKKGITEWIHNWKRRGWKRKTSNGLKPVKNVEQWMELDELVQKHKVFFELVRGHSGHPENERCDELAVQAYKDLQATDTDGHGFTRIKKGVSCQLSVVSCESDIDGSNGQKSVVEVKQVTKLTIK